MRVVIIGNSGSGKSTLAQTLSRGGDVPVLDLDTIAWEPSASPTPVRRPLDAVHRDLHEYSATRPDWIVEGCYGDIAELLLPLRPELILLDPGEAACLQNCRARPWEPHKYASKAAQDANLAMLLNWVSAYYTRDDDCSLRRHVAIFEGYAGPKRRVIRVE